MCHRTLLLIFISPPPPIPPSDDNNKRPKDQSMLLSMSDTNRNPHHPHNHGSVSQPPQYGDLEPQQSLSAALPVERFPETEQEGQLAETLLAQGLEQLSLGEHEQILFQIHGLDPPLEEDPEMIRSSLEQLQAELDQMTDKDAYVMAQQENAAYVNSRRLMFLRSRQFGAKEAALLMVRHFQSKQALFPTELLGKDIHYSDLSPLEQQMVDSGFMQVLPERDAAGRAVMMIATSNYYDNFPTDCEWSKESEFRLLWYMAMACLRDEETQKKGLVVIVMNLCSFKVSMDVYEGTVKLNGILPFRLGGAHYCYNDPALRPYVAGFQLLMDEKFRYQMQVHFGNKSELDFILQTYGIPMDSASPYHENDNGTIICSNAWHYQWVVRVRAQEERQQQHEERKEVGVDTTTKETILVPGRFDVLFGKQSGAREHTGTLRALHIVDMYFEEYEKLGKYQKTDVAEKIISIIHQSGGRFLKLDECGAWVEADLVESRKKVAHWFRHARSKRAKQLEEEETTRQATTESYTNTTTRQQRLAVGGAAKRVTPIASPVDPSWQEVGEDVVTTDGVQHVHKKLNQTQWADNELGL